MARHTRSAPRRLLQIPDSSWVRARLASGGVSGGAHSLRAQSASGTGVPTTRVSPEIRT